MLYQPFFISFIVYSKAAEENNKALFKSNIRLNTTLIKIYS